MNRIIKYTCLPLLICFTASTPAYAYLIETSAGVTLTGLGSVGDSDSSTNTIVHVSVSATGLQTSTDGINILTGEASARAEITQGVFAGTGASYALGVSAQTTGSNLTARSGGFAQIRDTLTVNLPPNVLSADIGVNFNVNGVVDGPTVWIDGFLASITFGTLTDLKSKSFNQNNLVVLPNNSIVPLTFSPKLTVFDNDTLFLSMGFDVRTVGTLLLDFSHTTCVSFDLPEGVTLTSETGIEFTGASPSICPSANDVVLNLPNPGVSVLLNDNTSSVALHPDTAEAIAVGDVDGNGIDDVIVSFPAGTGPTNTGGTWISRNQGALALLSPDTAEEIVAGDFTGTAGDELFMDFGGSGLWASVNGGAPFIATGLSPVAMAVGDVDNNGQDDLIFSITGLGTLVFKNLSAIAVLDVSAAQTLATGDVDGNGAADVIAGFRSGEGPTNAGGTWISRNEGALASLSPHKAEPAIAGDFDGNGEDDLFLDFDTNGLWASLNDSPPFLVVNLSPVAMAAGDLDNNGQDDLIFSLTGAGTLAFKNLSTLAPLDSGVALDLATGNVDGN